MLNSVVKTSAGKGDRDYRGDVHGRNGSVPNRCNNPPGAGLHSSAVGTNRSNDEQPDPRRSNINRGRDGGGGSPPGSPSPSVLDPEEMRTLMAGNATTRQDGQTPRNPRQR